ncbi:MAG TPA: efflux RND transporter periplasmic adaptor subunit [Burkholderiaceae bacterium]|nr:efflux RND transporter periplasmic adaptor subunit [Burkholderiaceae bacterium]
MPELSNSKPPLRSWPKRKLILSLLALGFLVGGGVAANNYLGQKNRPPVTTVTVVLGDVEKTVTSLGKLKPKDYVDVGTQVSGQLKKVLVQIGDRVQKGDLIAEVDATVYETRTRTNQANLENLRAQLVQQKAELELATRQAARSQELFNEKAASQDSLETNQSALKVANARVAATQAQIKASQATLEGDIANLGFTKIYAPMSGTVVSQTSLQGQTVNANQAAPVIVQIANLETMTVWAQVAEADVSKIKLGMPAYFSTLGDAGKRWHGTVRQVMPTPETVNDVVLYNVLVDVDNREQALMSQMTVQVFFVLEQAKGVPVVPLSALQPERGKQADKDANAYSAQVAVGDAVEKRSVKVGVSSRTVAAVESGLAVGDKVVVPQEAPSKTEAVNVAPRGGRGGMGARL